MSSCCLRMLGYLMRQAEGRLHRARKPTRGRLPPLPKRFQHILHLAGTQTRKHLGLHSGYCTDVPIDTQGSGGNTPGSNRPPPSGEIVRLSLPLRSVALASRQLCGLSGARQASTCVAEFCNKAIRTGNALFCERPRC